MLGDKVWLAVSIPVQLDKLQVQAQRRPTNISQHKLNLFYDVAAASCSLGRGAGISVLSTLI